MHVRLGETDFCFSFIMSKCTQPQTQVASWKLTSSASNVEKEEEMFYA